jgi:hypothetical protein
MPKKAKAKVSNETDVLDTMITSLVEILDEKGVVTQEEWNSKSKRT